MTSPMPPLRRALPGSLAALAGGILLASYLSPAILWFALPLALAPVAWYARRSAGSGAALRLFFLGLGMALALLAEMGPSLPPQWARWRAEPVRLEGVVRQRVPRPEGRWRLDLEQVRVCREERCLALPGGVRIYGETAPPATVPGCRVWLRTRLREPRLFGTPGEFDYRRDLARQGIFLTGFVASGEEVAIMAAPAPSLRFWLECWRQRIEERIDAAVAPEQAPLVAALAIGEKGAMAPALRQQLAAAGVAHLFALSGLHMGLVGWLLYLLARGLYRRSPMLLMWQPPQRVLPVLLLPPLFLYLLLAGAEAATQRAWLGAAGVAVLALAGRSLHPLRLLAAVALVLLLLQPLLLFSPGFQLSFAGTAGILLAGVRWSGYLTRQPLIRRLPGQLLLVTAAATLATAPLVLLHFHQLAPAGLLFNLWALPVVAWGAVPAALLGALATVPLPLVADACFRVCGRLIGVALAPASWGLRWSMLQPWPAWLPLSVIWAVAAAVVVLLLPGSRRRRGAGAAVLLGLALVLGGAASPAPPLRLHALSVGQGDAMLLTFAGTRHWLVDGGGLPRSSFDVGERLLAPALGRLGVRRLEGVLLSHRHPDHYLGLLFVLRHWPVADFYAAARPPEDLGAALAAARLSPTPVAAGWSWLVREPARELALWRPPPAADENDRSLVVYARSGEEGVLLTGDLAAPGVGRLLAAGVPGPVTLLKLPHHGSGRSGSLRLVDRLRPQAVFVSCGADNSFGFPAPSLVAGLEQRAIPLYRTDREGTLRFDVSAVGWKESRWNRGLFR